MGNRIIMESILTDPAFESLTFLDELLYIHLIVSADDYGICYGQPQKLARILFAQHGRVSPAKVREALGHLEERELIRRYTVRGAEYLQLCSWEEEQRPRNRRRRYPAPEETDEPAAAGTAKEAPAGRPAGKARKKRSGKPAPAAEPVPEVRELPVVELPLNDSTVYGVTRAEADEYAALYPAVDVEQELRGMRGWCLANPQRRKTRAGIRKFINRWLARAQDQGGSGPRPPVPVNPFLEMLREEEARERAEQEAVL